VQAQETNAARFPPLNADRKRFEGTTAADGAKSPDSTPPLFQWRADVVDAGGSQGFQGSDAEIVQTSSQVTYPTASNWWR